MNEKVIEENLRFFIEECDHLQGFQLMTDVQDGFGGLSAGFLELLRDDFPKTTMTTFGLKKNMDSSLKSTVNVTFNMLKII